MRGLNHKNANLIEFSSNILIEFSALLSFTPLIYDYVIHMTQLLRNVICIA